MRKRNFDGYSNYGKHMFMVFLMYVCIRIHRCYVAAPDVFSVKITPLPHGKRNEMFDMLHDEISRCE